MFKFQDWWLPEGETHLVEYLRQRPDYQLVQRRTSLEHVGTFGVAIDVGAHIGLWSRDLAALFEQVHAFEPVAAHAECFERNITARNVTLHRFALGRADGFVEAEISMPGNSGNTYVKPSGSGMPMRPLDSFAFSAVDFVKVDVEGAELFVCEGGKATLARCRPVVVIEQKKHGPDLFGVPQFAARDFLCGLGARVLEQVGDDWILGWDE